MKRFLRTLIVAILALSVCLGLVGCGEGVGKWKGIDLGTVGSAKTQGGFVLETDNYIFFINGQASYTDDNAYGTPVKGSLMVISVDDFKNGNFDKAQIAVPKLFSATDYKAGLYIYDGYVYYGTPNVNKDSTGSAASSEMTFFKTKLDGKEHKELFTVPSLSTEYRVVNSSKGVEILYANADKTEVYSYNVGNGKTTTIAKTDIEADESMTGYKFLEVVEGQPVLAFTNEVYSEKYFADKAEDSSYTRASDYSKLYTYTAGDTEAKEVISGKASQGEHDAKITITYLSGSYLFYTMDEHSEQTVYGAKVTELGQENATKEINDSALLANTTYIKSIEEVYVVNSSNAKVEKTTLTGSQATVRETVLITDTISFITNIRGEYAYFYNESNNLVRQKLNAAKANIELVSEGSASSTWFAPKFMTVGGVEYVVYLDSTTAGSFYLKALKLTEDNFVEEDTDEDGENDKFYFEGAKTLGKMLATDEAKSATEAMNKATASATLAYEIVDGQIVFEDYDKLVAVYEALSNDAKATLSEDFMTKYNNLAKAVKIAKVYAELDGMHNFDIAEEVTESLKEAYKKAKEATNKYSAEEFAEFRAYIPTNLKYEYQQAKKLLED